MSYYILYAETCIEEYVVPGKEIDILRKGCSLSSFQYLNHKPITVSVDDNGGTEFPDFLISNGCIPLISERMKRVFERNKVDNLFYKKIYLEDNDLARREVYWLALPPRINCLDFETLFKQGLMSKDDEDIPLWQWCIEAMGFKFISDNIGNYQIFKLSYVMNQDIFVTEALKNALQEAGLENVYFKKIEEE